MIMLFDTTGLMQSRAGALNPNYKGGRKPCVVPECGRTSMAKGLCGGHYQRLKKTGKVSPEIPLSKSRSGERNSNWRGGTMHCRGRVYTYMPNHPGANKQGYVARYRLVAEQCLGRLLRPNEVVHHINGDTSDDRGENLRVMSQSEHCSLHFQKTPQSVIAEIRRAGKSATAKQLAERFNIPVRRVNAIRESNYRSGRSYQNVL